MFPFNLRHPGFGTMAFMMRIVEPLIIIAGSMVAFMIRKGYGTMLDSGELALTVLEAFLYVFISTTLRLYEDKALREMIVSVPRLVGVNISVFGALLIILFMFKISGDYSRVWLLTWAIFTFATLVGVRWWMVDVIAKRVAQGRWLRRVAILGTNTKAHKLAHILETAYRKDFKLVGLYSLNTGTESEASYTRHMEKIHKYCGNFRMLQRHTKMDVIDDIIVAENLESETLTHSVLNRLNTLAVNVLYCMPLSLSGLTGTGMLDGLPLVLLFRKPMEGHSLMLKRMIDILASGTVLLMVMPVMLVIALIIKMTSPGPVFFRQLRGGFNGSKFEMLKFRSMYEGAASLKDESGKEMQAQKEDPRVTKIGKFIRKTSIDELPQLLNVLRGDMSLVGPRPHVPSHNSYYENLIEAYAGRHKMKPGLTGWAQLNGLRGETDTVEKMAKRVEYDIWYIENWSLWLDIKIILLTPFVVVFQKSAY